MSHISTLILFKSSGGTSRFTAGIEDFCGAGCLMVDQIRVPFPDCSLHGSKFDKNSKCDILRV